MIRASTVLKYWLPAALWMILIFSASSDSQSGQRSSRFIGPLIRWLVPGISEPATKRVVGIVRKIAHVTEYAVLAILIWWARRGTAGAPKRHWHWPHARFAFVIAVLYAVTDEIHQVFVPNRGPNFWDVVLDAGGAAFGLWLIWLFFRFKHTK